MFIELTVLTMAGEKLKRDEGVPMLINLSFISSIRPFEDEGVTWTKLFYNEGASYFLVKERYEFVKAYIREKKGMNGV